MVADVLALALAALRTDLGGHLTVATREGMRRRPMAGHTNDAGT